MSENSKIEWTDHTFNPWWGCMKVSEGCKNCYAEALDRRLNGGHWGPGSSRRLMSEKYWDQPLKWNEAANKAGENAKVFCASMADVFEGHPETLPHLARLFDLIIATPYLTWQLLTKRPENIMQLIPEGWREQLPENVWVGTSVESGEVYDRIEHLVLVPAVVRFLSCEPLLGPITLPIDWADGSAMVEWVIAGGESGPGARPCHPDWIRGLRDQCEATGTPFFFKQWGELLPRCQEWGFDPDADWPKSSRREFPSPHNPAKTNYYYKLGKSKSGALLDGYHHREFPEPLQLYKP